MRFRARSRQLLRTALSVRRGIITRCVSGVRGRCTSAVRCRGRGSLDDILTVKCVSTVGCCFGPMHRVPANENFTSFMFVPGRRCIVSCPTLIIRLG